MRRMCTSTVTVGEAPMVISIAPDGSQAFVTCADGIYAIRISSGAVRKAHARVRDAHGVTVTPDSSQAWVTDSENDQVIVIDTGSLREVGSVRVGRTPWNVAFTADGATAYVSNSTDDTVSVIDTARRRVTHRIALGSATLSAKNSSGSAVTFPVGNHIPTAITLGPDGNIWVTCNVPGTIPIIDPSSNNIVQTIDTAIGNVPTSIAFA